MLVRMAYLTYTELQELVTLPSDISTANMTTLIAHCTAILNSDINVKIIREPVRYLDATRENKIDGSNATYYVQNWKDWYLGDLDDDGDVDTDDIVFYQVDSDDAETELTVSTITHDEGKLVLSSAPDSTVNLYITYVRAPVDESTPDKLIKIALARLVAAYAFTKIDAQKIAKFRVGKVSVTAQSAGSAQMTRDYERVLNRIRERFMEAEEGEVLFK